MSAKHRLRPEQLRWTCDPARLGFETTADLKHLTTAIGQERAADALEFGVRMPADGYNIFVLGPVGAGRPWLARSVLEREARGRPVPGSWCYVYNFEAPNSPKAICLPNGLACEWRTDMDEFVDDVQRGSRRPSRAKSTFSAATRPSGLPRGRQAEFEAFSRRPREPTCSGRGSSGIVVAPGEGAGAQRPGLRCAQRRRARRPSTTSARSSRRSWTSFRKHQRSAPPERRSATSTAMW